MKRTYIQKIILSSVSLLLSMGLFFNTTQKVNAATDNKNNSEIQLTENNLTNNSLYFKEDIKSINFKTKNINEKINNINEKINDSINSIESKIKTQSKDYFDNFSNNLKYNPYELNVSYKLTNESSSLTSLYMDIYSFTAGAHGNTLRNAYTIDNNTKDLLSLNNLFVKGYDYKKIISNEISKKISNNSNNYLETAFNFKGITDDSNFYIEGENLVIYYQQYEIAPYSLGIPEFKIPLKLFGKNFIYSNSIIENNLLK